MVDLTGRSIIVTGGGSGIGRATSLLIAEAGAHVLIADRIEAAARETVAMIVARGGKAESSTTDVTQENEVAAMVALAVSTFGRLDGAVNCAGGPSSTMPLHELSIDQWRRCIDVNLTSAFYCLKYQLAAMLSTGGGSIVMISSTAALKSQPFQTEYAAAKAAILAVVRNVALDYARQGIRINAILPGVTDTPLLRSVLNDHPEIEQILLDQPLIGRLGRPDEIGMAIRWLLSDEASFTTGAAFPIDGGQTAR